MADALDILTLTEAKTVLGIQSSDTSQDASVARVVTTVSRRLDKVVGPVVVRAITSEEHVGWVTEIELKWCPVTAIGTVTNYLGATSVVLTEQTPGSVPSNAWKGYRYTQDPSLYSGIIQRRSGLNPYPFGDTVVVSYTAGRYAATASVDARFKEAGALMLRNLWRSYQQGVAGVLEFDQPQQNFPTYALPNAVKDLLWDEIKPEIGFG